MTEEVQTHQTSVTLLREVPAKIDAGTNIVLQVKVSCASGCDLRGRPVKIMTADGPVAETELVTFEEKANETAEFTVRVPVHVGQCSWSVLFPGEELEGVVHQESSLPISFMVRPHTTSLVAWDFPLPVTIGSSFKIKVGVTCSATCQLTGQTVEIHDEGGAKTGTGTLGETPWPETTGLYWGEVEIAAPSTEGVYSWPVSFPVPGLELPHEGAASKLSFRTARPPEHTVTVEVINKESKAPVKDAIVSLGIYRGSTDEGGVAKVEVPKGKYELYVSKRDSQIGSPDNYAPFQTTVEATDDATIHVELMFEPVMY